MFPNPVLSSHAFQGGDTSAADHMHLGLSQRIAAGTSHDHTAGIGSPPPRTQPTFTRQNTTTAAADTTEKAITATLATAKVESGKRPREDSPAERPEARNEGEIVRLHQSSSLGLRVLPVSRAVLNGWLQRWHNTNATIVSETGTRTQGELRIGHYAAPLREQGILAGRHTNRALAYHIQHFNPTNPNYAQQRSEPSLDKYDLTVVPDLWDKCRRFQRIFADLTRDRRSCTIREFLDAVEKRYPNASLERARHWYYEDLREGQVINWRSEACLFETSKVIGRPPAAGPGGHESSSSSKTDAPPASPLPH